jgi:hypothetical protein
MNNNDKINALVSIKSWAIERQMYELATLARELKEVF